MANKTERNLLGKSTEYNRYYTDMGGVDFSGDGSNISTRRFAYLQNMYRDWDDEGDGLTESIPGFRRLCALGERILKLYTQKTAGGDILLIHTDSGLYRLAKDNMDTAMPTKIASLTGDMSTGFPFGSDFYILNGGGYYRIDQDGVIDSIGEEESGNPPYIPTLFISGEEYEQRNLLSNRFSEEYTLSVPDTLSAGSEGLSYVITDTEKHTCALAGRGSSADADLYVPTYVTIGEEMYAVKEVSEYAFANDTALHSITLPEGLYRIGYYAFKGCTSLTSVITPATIEQIATGAMEGCTALTELYLGESLMLFSITATTGCTALSEIDCAFAEDALADITGNAKLSEYTLYFDKINHRLTLDVPIFTPASTISEVTLDAVPYEHTVIKTNGIATAIRITAKDKRELTGKMLRLIGTFAPYSHKQTSFTANFLLENEGAEQDTKGAILGCRVSELFDGRIFLSGNPDYPNTVFYSARSSDGRNNPTYFGVLNYFNDGIGSFGVGSLLSVGNSLAVFKEDDDGAGSIYYHTPKETGIDLLPKIYPVSYIHTGLCAKGEAISFYDDPVFVSENGISALEKAEINLERSVSCRSHNVNRRLLAENLSAIRLTKWRGYLVVLAQGSVYLADSRQTFLHPTGAYEYEWYYLSGIGTYCGDEIVYRYLSVPSAGYAAHPSYDQIAEGIVYSEEADDGVMHYYIPAGDLKYEVYMTEEYRGGSFSPACAIHAVGELLFFGTESGDLCVFNNDRRGVAPERIATASDFDPVTYAAIYGRRIHPDFYSFAGHAPRYALSSAMDNCGIPHLTKNTVKGSLTLKCRTTGASKICCEVGTDRSGYKEITHFPGDALSFTELDFGTLPLRNADYYTVAIKEKEKNWIEKQISVYSEEFNSPIALISISYRFTVRGKIRTK